MSEGVYVVGLGGNPPQDATLETFDVLESCPVVYTDLVAPDMLKWLGRYCPRPRRPAGAREVVSRARTARVCLAVWGHPQYTSELSLEVQRLCRQEKISCRILGANSPIGGFLAQSLTFLGGEEGCKGIQAYELKAFLADVSVLTTRLPLVLFSQAGLASDWKRAAHFLLKKYPSHHAVRVSSFGAKRPQASLKNLANLKLGGGVVCLPAAPSENCWVNDGTGPL